MGVKRPRSRFHDKKSLPCKGRWRVSAGGVGAGHDVRPCMGVKRPRSRFHDKKSLPCKGRWRVSAGGVGAGHDVPQCIVYKNAPCCKQAQVDNTHMYRPSSLTRLTPPPPPAAPPLAREASRTPPAAGAHCIANSPRAGHPCSPPLSKGGTPLLPRSRPIERLRRHQGGYSPK